MALWTSEWDVRSTLNIPRRVFPIAVEYVLDFGPVWSLLKFTEADQLTGTNLIDNALSKFTNLTKSGPANFIIIALV